MVTLTADVTEGIKKMTKNLVDEGLYKSQSEVVRDAIRQLALHYKVDRRMTREELLQRITTAGLKAGTTLSKTLREIRDED